MNKQANLIIVGGTIAAGKSSLVEGIAKETGWIPVPELRQDDKVQDIILKKLYEGSRIHLATIQHYFLTNRYSQYKSNSNNLITSILDRGVWEDWFFAKLLMCQEPKSYKHFQKLWKTTIQKIIDKFGYPKAYIFTKVDWSTFKERIFSRGREPEIANFKSNEKYFKDLLDLYNNEFLSLLKKWDIEPIVIDSNNLNKQETLKIAISEMKKRNIL